MGLMVKQLFNQAASGDIAPQADGRLMNLHNAVLSPSQPRFALTEADQRY